MLADMREWARRRLRGARARPGRARPNSEYSPPSGQDRRAISVPLAKGDQGSATGTPAARIGRSAPPSAVTVPLPKLTVRAGFVWVCADGPCHAVPARLPTTGTLEGEVERGHPVRCARLDHGVRGGHAIVITPDGATTYVVSTPNPDSYQGVVAPTHVATNTSGRPIRVGKAPSHIAITPDGTMAYVTNLGSGTVTPIRVVNGTADKAIRVGMAPADLTITPDGKVVYVVNSILCLPGPCGMVTPIRVATGTAGAPVRVGRFPLGIAISS